MPTSSIVTFPGIAAVFTTMQPYSQGIFDNFLTPVMIGVGIFIGALVVILVAGAIMGGMHKVYEGLMGLIHGKPVNRGHVDSTGRYDDGTWA